MTPSRTLALLGPTNTGKTHHAVERMLSHPTGMIGLPLRLLAREVYDRVTARLGEAAVALVTGEEKRIPPRPRYWVCTVEAMPLDRATDFVAVDEVQLGAHRERGHVFTDRLLSARGRIETWFLGADTVRPLVRELVPGVELEARPRLSTLRSVGRLSLRELPPRSAIVAFSAQRVYELAERMRARRGGAAVVLGALSPRARNAQVALYQSGEVDTLVATDAIGMGLNLDVDLVAFADLAKFDGRQVRALEEGELAQIAGRAGRFRHDGAFAVLEPLEPLAPSVVRALESHRFPALTQLYWRNGALDFSSAEALLTSLHARSPHPALRIAPLDDDERAFLYLKDQPETEPLLNGAGGDRLRLAWEVCQIPDFRQLAFDDHLRFQAAIFTQLTRAGRLDETWLRERIAPLDHGGGDVETLTARLAFIRTWNYVAHRPGWVDDATAWQELARAIEDRLSDALHAELVRRFVDSVGRKGRRRAARAAAGPGEGARADREGAGPGSGVLAERLRAALGAGVVDAARPLAVGASERLPDAYVESIVDAPHEAFALEDDGRIRFRDGAVLARLARGPDLLRPEVSLLMGEPQVGAGARLRLMRRLLAFARDVAAHLLAAIGELPPSASPRVRGIVYQVEQGLGTLVTEEARAQLRDFEPEDSEVLSRLGLVRGMLTIHVPALLRDEPLRARAILTRAHFGTDHGPRVPRPGELLSIAKPDVPTRAHVAAGFPVVGDFAVRADVLEGLARRLQGGASPRELARRVRCPPEQGLALSQAIRAAMDEA
jgi:ATP-dependent RNA helicase SUPV3L1/SUV3